MSTEFSLAQVPLLSRTAVDRADQARADAQALAAGWARARVLRVNHRGQARADGLGLALEPAAGAGPPEGAVLLGVEAGGEAVWAVRGELAPGPSMDLRLAGAGLPARDAGLLTSALAILNWHDAAGFCGRCGQPTRPVSAGWARVCAGCGHEEYPRTDPAVICLVHDGADQVLLARQPVWPPRRYSVLAGFVEAGESAEACVAREVREEVGVAVRDVRYLGSQPWPFPRSIMLGFHAVADPAQPVVCAEGEIEHAAWFTRGQVREALAAGDWMARGGQPLLLPGAVSIARGMLEAWAAAG